LDTRFRGYDNYNIRIHSSGANRIPATASDILTDLADFELQGDPGGKIEPDLSTWIPFPSHCFAMLGGK
jgi:hypothetical protein